MRRSLSVLLLFWPTLIWGFFETRGYVKTYPSIKFNSDEKTHLEWQNAFRLMLDVEFWEGASLQIHNETLPFYSTDFSNPRTLFSSSPTFRVVDFRRQLFPYPDQDSEAKWILFNNLDRVRLRWETAIGDLTFGRQAIAFGAGRSINPTDVFVPFGAQTLNVEYRNGIDAARLQVPLGDLSELDLGYVVGEKGWFERSAAFGRVRFSVLESDLAFVGVHFIESSLIGFSLQRPLWLLGYWFEGALTYPKDGSNYGRFTSGLDYAFSGDLSVVLEYHFNGAGAFDPMFYPNRISTFAYQKGGVFLLGRHYLTPSLNWLIFPLLSSSYSLQANLRDDSFLGSIHFEYNVFEDIYFDLGAYGAIGKKNEDLTVRSEFGNYPSMVYSAVRYYF